MDEDTDWSMISFEPKDKDSGGASASPVSVKTCPKCGRKLGRGAHFHIKACEGKK